MSNPTLDRAAQLVADRRATGELAVLDAPERHLVDQALKIAPELDGATVGAAWMILGDALMRFVQDLPDQFPASALVTLAQLAGQRLYTGTDLPREVQCPVVRGNGSRCRFTAKAVTQDLIDAQMRGHYGTYHEHLTWPPHEYDGILATLDGGEYAGSAEHDECDPEQCSACGDPIAPTGEDGTSHGYRVGGELLCERCVILDRAVELGAEPAAADGAGLPPLPEKPTPQSVREGRHSLDDFRRAYRLPVIEIPEGVFPEAVGPLLEAAFAEAERAHREQEDEPLPENAVGRCRRCGRAVGVAPHGNLLPGYVTVDGIECTLCTGVMTKQEMRDELAKDGE